MGIMKKKGGKLMFQKTNKVKKDQRVQKESFFSGLKEIDYFYNLIVILGYAFKSPLKKIEMLKQEE